MSSNSADDPVRRPTRKDGGSRPAQYIRPSRGFSWSSRTRSRTASSRPGPNHSSSLWSSGSSCAAQATWGTSTNGLSGLTTAASGVRRKSSSGCFAYHWSSWSSPATSTAAARRPVRPARPDCWRSDASVPGNPFSTTASRPPTSMPSSSALVAATPSKPAVAELALQLAPLAGQEPGAVCGDALGERGVRREPPPRRCRDQLRSSPAAREREGRPTVAYEPGQQLGGLAVGPEPAARLLVHERTLPEPEAPLGLGRAVVVDRAHRPAAQRRRELGRVADRRTREAERRAGPVVRAHPLEPAQHVRDVAAEDAAQRVQLVDDHELQAHEERRPASVVGEDRLVQHLRVRQHDVGVLAGPGPIVRGRVAVVRDRLQTRTRATIAVTAADPARAPWSGTSAARSRAHPGPPSRRSGAGSRATCRTRSPWRRRRSRPRAARRSPPSGGSTARRSHAPRDARRPRRGGAGCSGVVRASRAGSDRR